MLEFLSADQNFPFVVALGLMLGIACLEGVSALFGMAMSNAIDAMLPDDFLGTGDGFAGPDLDSPTALSRLLGWLRVGQVPVLMLLVIFLTAFSLLGFALQSFSLTALGFMLPAVVASMPVFVGALPVVRVLGGVLSRVMPKDETDAVSSESLVGRLATLTLGEATAGRPAEARVQDTHGATHYVMVEPDDASTTFAAHSMVLLVRQDGHVFKAIKNTNAVLSDAAAVE